MEEATLRTLRKAKLKEKMCYEYSFTYSCRLRKEAAERGIKSTAASCMLMKELGKTTYFSKGSEENLKITTTDDLKIFKALLHTRQDDWIKTRTISRMRRHRLLTQDKGMHKHE